VRYIVAAVSLLVALVVLFLNVDSDADPQKQKKTRALDFFTGRYLLDRWADWKSARGRAHELGRPPHRPRAS
jgi:hypothetical protein